MNGLVDSSLDSLDSYITVTPHAAETDGNPDDLGLSSKANDSDMNDLDDSSLDLFDPNITTIPAADAINTNLDATGPQKSAEENEDDSGTSSSPSRHQNDKKESKTT